MGGLMTCYHRSLMWKKEKSEKNDKKGKKKKKWSNLWSIHQCLQIGCKLRLSRLFLPIQVDHNNFNF